jgi:hypothetical protein
MENLKVNIGSPEENARVLEIFNGPDGSLLQRYFNQKTSFAIQAHDLKNGYIKPNSSKALQLYKVAIRKCIVADVDPEVIDILDLRFKSEEDIDAKIKYLKTKKRWGK